MSKREYWPSDYTYPMNAEDVAKADKETQKEIMLAWFSSKFENPVECLPYESREGGYQYIWGGPYNAGDELYNEFGDIVSEEVIENLVSELEEECDEWSGNPDAMRYDDYLFDNIVSNTQFHEIFLNSINNINNLLSHKIDVIIEHNYYMLLYVNIITTLETYLSDAFINTVMNDKDLIRKFVETNPEFAQLKFSLCEIFSKMEKIESNVKSYLVDLIWHNLEKVKPMYKRVLDVDFPDNIRDIFKAILIRHDIVHRNGKTKEGNERKIEKNDLINLIDKINFLVEDIDMQLAEQSNSMV